MSVSHFDQRSGIVACDTPWGKWWQTLNEVFIEVRVPPGTRGKDCIVEIKPKSISCRVHNKEIFKGELKRTVARQESTWTLEERKKIVILLSKAEGKCDKNIKAWESLLVGQYSPNPYILQEMMKKLDLEQFQIENPGFDFSNAMLSKNYDRIPCATEED